MVTEASTSMRNVTRYYGNSTIPGAHFSFNFLLLPVNANSDANTVYNFIRTWCTSLDQELPNNWLVLSIIDNKAKCLLNFVDWKSRH